MTREQPFDARYVSVKPQGKLPLAERAGATPMLVACPA